MQNWGLDITAGRSVGAAQNYQAAAAAFVDSIRQAGQGIAQAGQSIKNYTQNEVNKALMQQQLIDNEIKENNNEAYRYRALQAEQENAQENRKTQKAIAFGTSQIGQLERGVNLSEQWNKRNKDKPNPFAQAVATMSGTGTKSQPQTHLATSNTNIQSVTPLL